MPTPSHHDPSGKPITLRAMGSLFFAGTVLTNSEGDTYHGDHGYAQYFVPEPARTLPFIMWHGLGQSGKTWESTPDGREGFWQIFSRRDWATYIIDQPRRGRAGRAILDPTEHTPEIPNLESEATTWEVFRLGLWTPPGEATYFDGVSWPTDERSREQFFRQQTPNTGPEPFPDATHRDFMANAMGDLIDQVGDNILMTHSHSGQYGWRTVMRRPEAVKAVIAMEVGEFAFPADAPPEEIPTTSAVLHEFMAGQLVPPDEFEALTRMPILLVYGDNVATEPDERFGVELWRITLIRAQQFVDAVNARGGDARLLALPDVGLRGNTHFPMTDLNNVEVADVICNYLAEKGLAGYEHSHQGPAARPKTASIVAAEPSRAAAVSAPLPA